MYIVQNLEVAVNTDFQSLPLNNGDTVVHSWLNYHQIRLIVMTCLIGFFGDSGKPSLQSLNFQHSLQWIGTCLST